MTEKNETIGDMPHAQKIMDKLRHNKDAWQISRVPKNTREAIIKLADDEFCGDRGMALKWLVDDMISPDTKAIIEAMTSLEARVMELESKVTVTKTEPEDNKSVKMCDGSKRERRGTE